MGLADPAKAAGLRRFFKTGEGQYGEGDSFLGIMVPAIRRLSREFRQFSLKEVEYLLRSAYNEERLLALLILAEHYRAMPRTMLRYAIERLPAAGHRAYLTGRA